MITWSQADGFREVEGLFEWNDGEDSKQWAARIGFEESDHFICDAFEMTVYQSLSKDSPYTTIVDLGDPVGWLHWIAISSSAELMAFRLVVARLAYEMTVASTAVRLLPIVEKSFRAWHGHSIHNACVRCDPETIRREEAQARARMAATFANGGGP